jgi:hypothetical protein
MVMHSFDRKAEGLSEEGMASDLDASREVGTEAILPFSDRWIAYVNVLAVTVDDMMGAMVGGYAARGRVRVQMLICFDVDVMEEESGVTCGADVPDNMVLDVDYRGLNLTPVAYESVEGCMAEERGVTYEDVLASRSVRRAVAPILTMAEAMVTWCDPEGFGGGVGL